MTVGIFDNLSFYNRSKLLDLADGILNYYIKTNLVNENEDDAFFINLENYDQLKLWTYHRSNNIGVRITLEGKKYFKSFEKVSEVIEWLLLKAMQ